MLGKPMHLNETYVNRGNTEKGPALSVDEIQTTEECEAIEL